MGRPEDGGGTAGLPMLTVTEDMAEGMGFEGLMAFDVSELVSANPWSESAGLTTMPVYKNPVTYDEERWLYGVDTDAMADLLFDVAERLGLDPDSLNAVISKSAFYYGSTLYPSMEKKVGEELPEQTYFHLSSPPRVTAEADGIEIVVDSDMTATLSFDPAMPLPVRYDFTFYASYEDTAAVAEYLKEAYGNFIGMENPQINIGGGDYNIYREQSYQVEFFDGSGSLTDRIVNYNFNRVVFYGNDEGELFLARVFAPDLSEKVGDYPIITVEQARTLLAQGNYITTVPTEMPGMDHVSKVELIYRTGELEQYYMPYYRFYVELPEYEQEDGLKTYGAYYVPAVEGTYLTNMPVWNGSFN